MTSRVSVGQTGAGAQGLSLENGGVAVGGGPFTILDALGGITFAFLAPGIASITAAGGVGPGTVNTLAMFTGVNTVGNSAVKQGADARGAFVTTPDRLFVGDPPVVGTPYFSQFGLVAPVNNNSRIVEIQWGDGTQALHQGVLEGLKMELAPVNSGVGASFFGLALANTIFGAGGADSVASFVSLDLSDGWDATVTAITDYFGLRVLPFGTVSANTVNSIHVDARGANALTDMFGVRVRGLGTSGGRRYSFFSDTGAGPAFFGDGMGTSGLQAAVSPEAVTFTVSIGQFTMLCDATGGAIVANLPDATTLPVGAVFNVKKVDTSGNTVTVTPFAGQLIDTAATFVISTPMESVQFQSDGTNWYVI